MNYSWFLNYKWVLVPLLNVTLQEAKIIFIYVTDLQ